eukprot:4307743-Pleurochrysis_carterae.AAC.1
MCECDSASINDRAFVRTQAVRAVSPRRADDVSVQKDAAVRHSQSSTTTVSYTHLRAHETDSYL